MEYKRICPDCGKELEYNSYSAWYKANKTNSSCRRCGGKKNKEHSANLSRLLEDTPEAFYWIGFLLADGSFSGGRLKLTLKKSDADQVHKFGNFVEYTGSYGNSEISESVTCKDIDVVEKICNKFDIKPRKTYNPPETLLKFDKHLLIALLAGFIDGDGRIAHPTNRRDFFLTIKNHCSWITILKEFNSLICKKDFCKVNSSGYAVLTITDSEILKKLKRRILTLNLPILSRKWDVIDMSFISKYQTAKILREKVISLYLEGKRNKDISEECGTSPSNVTKIIKQYKKCLKI